MLDAVSEQAARGAERREREHELDPRHAVDRDPSGSCVRGADALFELLELWEVIVAQQQLDRTQGDPVRLAELGAAHYDELLGQSPLLDGRLEGGELVGSVAGRGVRETGQPEPG